MDRGETSLAPPQAPHSFGLGLPGEVSISTPSTHEILEGVGCLNHNFPPLSPSETEAPLPGDTQKVNPASSPLEVDGNKAQKVDGAFSGDTQPGKRVKDWMSDDELHLPEHKTRSYRDALKPNTTAVRIETNHTVQEEVWDGYLTCKDESEMLKGVTVSETSGGLNIDFSETEKLRLESKWRRSLIIKLLGSSVGFMQMKRRVQLMWGKSGTVTLNDIGNGYFIASFQSLEDYFFALEGGP